MLTALLFAANAMAVTPDHDASMLNDADRSLRVRLNAEIGSLAPLSHVIQFDKQGTEFNYIKQGGQDNLYLFARLSADLDIGDRNSLVLLYQPLNLTSTVRLDDDLVVDDATFAAGTPMNLRYGFDFVRASWLYDLQPDRDRELALGLSLQLRNAVIDFQAVDGSEQRSNRDIGPVPILKFRTRQPWGERGFWGVEADGFYAPVSYLNGDNNEVVGAILDGSVRAGLEMSSGVDMFVNLRYIGGGAEGIDDDSTGPGDGYTRNWIHLAALSLGFSLR